MVHWLKTGPYFACVVCCLGGCSNAVDPTQQSRESPRVVEAPSTPRQEQLEVSAGLDEAPRKAPIARILGKELFEEYLDPPAGDEAKGVPLNGGKLRKYRRERLHSLLWRALLDQYCLAHQIEATPEEIEQYRQAMKQIDDERLGQLRAEWEADETTDERRHELTEELQLIESLRSNPFCENFVAEFRKALEAGELTDLGQHDTKELSKLLAADGTEPPELRILQFFNAKLDGSLSDEERKTYTDFVKSIEEMRQMLEAFRKIPENAVKSWKFDRALHAEYGGVVIFQQMNPFEPVGAYRKWLEAHEQAGDFVIFDEAERDAFWHYYKDNAKPTTGVVRDPNPFDQPWWLKRSN